MYLEQALYPVEHVTWCVYALFIDDELVLGGIVNTLSPKYQAIEQLAWEDISGQ